MIKKVELIGLGEKIKRARLRAKLTQAELAHSIDKDQPSINRLEAGRINPSYFYLLEVAGGIGISIVELLSDSQDNELEEGNTNDLKTDSNTI